MAGIVTAGIVTAGIVTTDEPRGVHATRPRLTDLSLAG